MSSERAAGGRELIDFLRGFLADCRESGIRVSTRTRSMAPFFAGDETVRWREPDPPPRVGDVVIFFLPGGAAGEADVPAMADPPAAAAGLRRALSSLVVHRVIAIDAGGLLQTKGDNRLRPDLARVPPDHVLGVVTTVVGCRRPFDLRGAGARLYGRLVAAASRLTGRLPEVRGAWRLQRLLLGGCHLLLHRALHRRPPDPGGGRGDA